MTQGVVKQLIDMPVIGGKKIMVFECGRPPTNEYGDADIAAYTNNVSQNRDVYYEAFDMTVEWFKAPFYVGITVPTHDELNFQLHRWHSQRQIKFGIAGVVFAIILYIIFMV